MSTAVVVPAELIRAALTKAGFKDAGASAGAFAHDTGREEVWERAHDRDPNYIIKVYTSLTRGAAVTREKDSDAIRVVVVKKDGMRFPARFVGVWKSKRVHRTGSAEKVVERMLERAREAYAFVGEALAKSPVAPVAPVAIAPTPAAPLSATYTKLRDGSWGVRVEGKTAVGQTVTVMKKSGETKQETISRVLWTGEGIALCAIVSDTARTDVAQSGHDVTSEKKV